MIIVRLLHAKRNCEKLYLWYTDLHDPTSTQIASNRPKATFDDQRRSGPRLSPKLGPERLEFIPLVFGGGANREFVGRSARPSNHAANCGAPDCNVGEIARRQIAVHAIAKWFASNRCRSRVIAACRSHGVGGGRFNASSVGAIARSRGHGSLVGE